MKKIPCILIINAPKSGHIFAPQPCESIAEARRRAVIWGFPYRIFNNEGKLLEKGWKT